MDIAKLPHWRFMPGMLCEGSRLICPNNSGEWFMVDDEDGSTGYYRPGNPDLEDPATLGCLRKLVEDAWGANPSRRVTVEPAGAGWCVIVRNARHSSYSKARPGWDLDRIAHPPRGVPQPFGCNEFPTEAEALVVALKNAT